MRLTCIICTINLIILGVSGGAYAFSGFNLLMAICFYNAAACKCYLAICGVCALFVLYALIVFHPFKGLK